MTKGIGVVACSVPAATARVQHPPRAGSHLRRIAARRPTVWADTSAVGVVVMVVWSSRQGQPPSPRPQLRVQPRRGIIDPAASQTRPACRPHFHTCDRWWGAAARDQCRGRDQDREVRIVELTRGIGWVFMYLVCFLWRALNNTTCF